MKVTQVEAIPFAIPYRKPLRFASGEVHVAEHVLVRVHTDDGVVGVAEAPPRPFTYGETQAGVLAVIDQIFAPAGRRPAPARARDHARAAEPHGRQPRRQGQPSTWRSGTRWAGPWGCRSPSSLGGYTDRMRVSHMLGFAEPAAMVAEAERMRATYGITTFKVKVGRTPVPSRHRRGARAARGSRRRGRAVRRRQPRLDRVGVRARDEGDGRPRT